MECNKDEAVRAKEIAENKLFKKDITGAKKFAVKAQNLYPELDGISQMMATLDVYIASENKINGEGNWYGILGVNPLADSDTVRKQFRKLALMFHPDKNKTVGAEGAFKLISEAWNLLSDKSKKVAYDKRIAAVVQNGGSNAGPSPSHMQNGFYHFAKTTASHKKVPKGNSKKAGSCSSSASSHKQEKRTFWTVCHQCKMQYEYLTMYCNRNLLCPNCHEAFFAVEIAPPSSNIHKTSSGANYSQKHQNMHFHETEKKSLNRSKRRNPNGGSSGFNSNDSSNYNNFQWVPFSSTTGAASAAQAANMVQQAYEKVKRQRVEAQATTRRDEALRKKNHGSKRASGAAPSGYSDATKRKRTWEDCGTGVANTTSLFQPKEGGYEQNMPRKACDFRYSKDFNHINNKQILVDKARKDLSKGFKIFSSSKSAKSAADKEMNGEFKYNDEENKETDVAVSVGCDSTKFGDELNTLASISNCDVSDHFIYGYQKQLLQQFFIAVPDSDFHDFERDRLEKSFGDNQIWAAYDDIDGMPRCYAMIHRVVSLIPFKMQISWLIPATNGKLSSVAHVGSGFLRTCRDFKLGRRETVKSIDYFSHKVNWTRDACGAIEIFPKKGEVWALYRNWTVEWNELTEDEVIRKYDMVEVLEGYNEQEAVVVIPVLKVAGFKTLFHRHLNIREIRQIPKEEMFRFSHQVPSYVLTGKEVPNSPKGCLELDPAATPSELLQVFMDIKDEFPVDVVRKDDQNEKKECLNEAGKELPGSSGTID